MTLNDKFNNEITNEGSSDDSVARCTRCGELVHVGEKTKCRCPKCGNEIR